MHAACVLFLMLAFLAVSQGTPGQQCGPPEIRRYGSIVGGVRQTYDVGDYVKYSCDSGFELQGAIVAVCIHTASQGTHWNKPPPRCNAVDCGRPESPENGRVNILDSTMFLSKVKYSCNNGFVLIGSEYRTCQKTGEWSPEVPTCRSEQCSDLQDPENGRVSLSGRNPSSTASYSCNQGYNLIGPSTRTCQENGQWTGGEPVCRIVDCRLPQSPENGRVSAPNGTTFGEKVWYFCNTGFVVLGSEFSTCQANGEWVPAAPQCIPEPPKCLELTAPDSGRVVLTGTTPGSIATYSCMPGYVLVGDKVRTCQRNGEWTSIAPFCRLVDCGRLPNPSNGHIDFRRATFGSFVRYACNPGFHLAGSVTRVCQANGQWSGQPPICNPVECDPLDYPDNGIVTLDGTRVGSVATYSCTVGFVLVGDEERTCQTNGEWSGREPVCNIVDCGTLSAPANGIVELTGTAVGDGASYTCDTGFFLEGEERRECQNNGEWSGDQPACKAVFCPKLHNPPNGLVRVQGKKIGSRSMYECFNGYVLVGNEYRTCQPNGEWSGAEPECIYTDCGHLSDPDNGQVTISGTSYWSKARYRCHDGFILVGVENRSCEANGLWSGEAPECLSVGCELLDRPENGDVFHSGRSFGSTATYVCNIGFTLAGKHKIRTCRRNGEWSGHAPVCRPTGVPTTQCPYLLDPPNGRVTLTGTSVGSTATYTCNRGFTLVGESRRVCQPNGQWSGTEPICRRFVVPVDCGQLQNPRNGQVTLTGTTAGSTAIYSCNAGFVLDGGQTRTCQPNGQWSGREPQCRRFVVPVDCGQLQNPRNGQVTLTGTTAGSTAIYSCNPGFVLDGRQTRTCQPNGQWSGREPQCRRFVVPVDCGQLQNPTNGQVTLTGTTAGSTAIYSCNPGFILDGGQTRTCQPNGQWSGREPQCRRIVVPVDCGQLQNPRNGRVVLTGTTAGSTAIYSCNPGFVLDGGQTRTCQPNGQWSGREPICRRFVVPVDCGQLQNPTNGRVVLTGTTAGSTAIYSCNPGFVLDGGQTRTCQPNGQWSGREPICRPEECPALRDPENGQVDVSGNTVGATATYTCNSGFVLVGVQRRVCQRDGVWSGEEPTCEPVECGQLEDPTNGRVLLSGTTVGAKATYVCNRKFTLVGNSNRECQPNGRWSGQAPLCEFIDCGELEGPANGQVVLNGTICGSVARYSCNDGYVLVGEDTRTCQRNAAWSGQAPVCRPVDCGDLQDPQNGQVILRGTTVNSRATYTCNPGFILVGDASRICLPNGVWSGRMPTCEPTDCGSLENPENGQVELSSTTLGSTARYSCNRGYILVGQQTRTCQASREWSGSAPICRPVDCGALLDPANGRVVLSGTILGSTATYSCNEGFALDGNRQRVCQFDGQWSGEAPSCRPVDCGSLQNPENGRVILTGTTFGSTATYTCIEGFDLVGSSRRVCQANGEWSGQAPVCRPVDCGSLQNPENGRVILTGTTFGSKATYTCNVGFRLVGRNMRMCLASGQWMGEAPVCRPLDCGPLDDPENGRVLLRDTIVDSVATYSCNRGFVLVGEQTRTCQVNGQWSGEAPVCRPVGCGNLPNPQNGQVSLTGTTLNSVATYSCNRGFVLVGEQTRICQINGQWSGEGPVCRPVDCGNLQDPLNGQVSLTGTTFESTATYTCNRGFSLVGNNRRVCQANGEWSAEAPTCQPVDCGDLEDPENGRVFLTGTTFGSKATYICNKGFRLVGRNMRMCLVNGQWMGEAPVCRSLDCGPLDDPENGRVLLRDTIVDSVATYSCNRGFVLVGEQTRTCQVNGEWSGEAPVCRPVDCSNLPNPQNGQVSLTGTTLSSVATYSCNRGFVLVGEQTRTCQVNGQWSGEAPVCRPVDCGNLPNPQNGQVSLTGTTLSSVATYSCNRGFILVGEQTRICQINGQWSGEAPVCRPIDCGNLQDPLNGQVSLTGTTFESTATYTCNRGFSLVGNNRRVCQANGEWSAEAPTCQPVDCGDLEDPENGRVFLTGTTIGSKATYICNKGFRLVGRNMRMCLVNGQWMGEAPVCRSLDCGPLDDPENGRVLLRDTIVDSVATYSCNRGFVLVGEQTRTCQVNGQWSGEAPVCRPVDCGSLPNPQNGQVSLTGTTLSSVATYSCNRGFVLVGEQTRTCQVNGQWSGEAPVCRPVDCGNLPNPQNGQVSLTGTTLNSVATYSCNRGFILVGEQTRICQINGQWSGEAPVCRPIDCGNLQDPLNGQVSLTGTTFESTATYTCNRGFSLVGNNRRVCQANGEWSAEAPTCQPVDCGDLEDPENGRVFLTGTTFGSKATYICNKGFRLVGRNMRMCLVNGQWMGEAPVCRSLDCGPLDDPENGRVLLRDTIVDSVATYSCNRGFVLVGEQTRTCQVNGQWSGEAPVCRPVDCGNLPNPQNGQVSLTGTTPSSVATYSCNRGFVLVGEQTRICQINGQWSGEAPVCRPVGCGNLPNPNNGQVRLSGTTLGSTAFYTCNRGYVLVGNGRRTCQANGQWSGREPTCTPVDCGNLDNPQNGQVRLSGTVLGSTATYSCNNGFRLVGQNRRVCQPSGEWSGEAPTCEVRAADCGRLEDPENGMIMLRGTTVGSRALYTCNQGFMIQGDAFRFCQSNGEWSGEAPICVRISCRGLRAPDNGFIDVTGFKVGDTARYFCRNGFELVGNSVRRCLNTGVWSGSVPTCRRARVDCSPLSNPNNGQVQLSGTAVGSQATYTCNPGYTLRGDSTRTCLSSGRWSGVEPVCERAAAGCSSLAIPNNGQVHLSSTVVGSVAIYSCNSGYILKGSRTRTCQASGQWSGEAPVCKTRQQVNCGFPSPPHDGFAHVSCTAFGCRTSYWCRSGFTLHGSRVRVCQSGGHWSGGTPTCIHHGR